MWGGEIFSEAVPEYEARHVKNGLTDLRNHVVGQQQNNKKVALLFRNPTRLMKKQDRGRRNNLMVLRLLQPVQGP